METIIRAATSEDVAAIMELVNSYAAENIMLPRTSEQINQALPWFLVATCDDKVVGCGSLVALTPQLVELRSLAVAQSHKGTGLGRRLVEELVRWARESGYEQICALTLSEAFFNHLGFPTVDRWTISPKIWHECIFCPKFDACDETAVLLNLIEPAAETHERWLSPLQSAWKPSLS